MTQQNSVRLIKKITKEWLELFSTTNNIPLLKDGDCLILNEKRIGIRGSKGGVSSHRFGIRETKESDYDYLIFCVSEIEIPKTINELKFVLLDSSKLVRLKLTLGTSDKSFKLGNHYKFMSFEEFKSDFQYNVQDTLEYFVDEVESLNSFIEEQITTYIDKSYDEGTKKMINHYRIERNSTVVKKAKQQFEEQNGCLYCEICKFDYFKAYGVLGRKYIEAHHKNPLSLNGETTTRVEDLALLCANCHRMIHRLMKNQSDSTYEKWKATLKKELDSH